MKKLVLAMMLGIASAVSIPATAQINVSVNIGSQPQWGPRGYDYVEYYYLPDLETYYHVPTKRYVYYSGSKWIHARNLPSRYRSYNLYNGRKVVINSPRPYLKHRDYKTKYVKYKPQKHYKVKGRGHDKQWDNNHCRGPKGDRGHGRGRD